MADTRVNIVVQTQGQRKLQALNNTITKTVAQLGLLAGGIGSLSSAFNTLQRQDFAIAKVKSLGVNSKALVGNLREVSKELKGQASVVDLTAAAYDVASAGFTKAADASKVLKAASLGAVGGFSDINTVGNATTSVLNAYGKSASEAGRLVDQFIQTQNDGKIVVAEYARNIGKVASAAAGLKIPLSEVNAVIAQATAAGVQSEVAFTGLKSALARLASGEASKALKDVGIDINAATIEADGLLGTLRKLQGLDTGTIFKALGTEAGPALLPVIQNLEKFEQLIKNQENSIGAAAKAQELAANTITGALKRIQTAFENAFTGQTKLAQGLIKTFNSIEDAINGLVAFIESIPGPVLEAIGSIGLMVAKLLLLKTAIDAIMATRLGVAFFAPLLGHIGKANFALAAFTAKGKLAAASTTLLASAMKTIPWVALGAGLIYVTEETIKAIAAKKSFEQALKSVDRAIVEAKIKELEEELVKVDKAARDASGSMSLLGGSMNAAGGQAAILRSQIAQLKGELAGLPSNYKVGGIEYDYKTGAAINPPATVSDKREEQEKLRKLRESLLGGGSSSGGGAAPTDDLAGLQAQKQLLEQIAPIQERINQAKLAGDQMLVTRLEGEKSLSC